MKKQINWLLHPPVSGPSAIVILRLMAGGVFFWEGLLKFVYVNQGVGRFTKLGASVMVMGLCGNAILPLVYGWLADHLDPRQAYWVLLPCYCYLFFYALVGHRIKNWPIFKSKQIR